MIRAAKSEDHVAAESRVDFVGSLIRVDDIGVIARIARRVGRIRVARRQIGVDDVDVVRIAAPLTRHAGNDRVATPTADDDVAATVEVGPDQEMVLAGAASGVDEIDVIEGGKDGSKGKSGSKFK